MTNYPTGTPSVAMTGIWNDGDYTPEDVVGYIKDNLTPITKNTMRNSLGAEISKVQNFVNSSYLGRVGHHVMSGFIDNINLSGGILNFTNLIYPIPADWYTNGHGVLTPSGSVMILQPTSNEDATVYIDDATGNDGDILIIGFDNNVYPGADIKLCIDVSLNNNHLTTWGSATAYIRDNFAIYMKVPTTTTSQWHSLSAFCTLNETTLGANTTQLRCRNFTQAGYGSKTIPPNITAATHAPLIANGGILNVTVEGTDATSATLLISGGDFNTLTGHDTGYSPYYIVRQNDKVDTLTLYVSGTQGPPSSGLLPNGVCQLLYVQNYWRVVT